LSFCATTQQVFNLPRKKHFQAGKEQALAESPSSSRPAGEDPGELQQFVDNYLTLADKALGFMRRPGNNNLTISTCCFCKHTIASTNLKLLGFAESLHVCPAKPSRAAEDNDAAA
jgi:hypothetical protein